MLSMKGSGASRWEENTKVHLALSSPRGARSWKALTSICNRFLPTLRSVANSSFSLSIEK